MHAPKIKISKMFPTGPNELKAISKKIRTVDVHTKTQKKNSMPENITTPVGGTVNRIPRNK